jgi:hypothetical protein
LMWDCEKCFVWPFEQLVDRAGNGFCTKKGT